MACKKTPCTPSQSDRHSLARVMQRILNSFIICGAAGITRFFERSPGWVMAQRCVMGRVLAGLALRIAITERK